MSNALLYRPKNIAVIDDSEAVRRSLTVLLTARGYAAVGFDGGSEFLASPLKTGFDYLLIDYKMDDMSGTDLLKRLRGEGVDTPAAMVSGWETSGLEKLALESGFAAFIRKPMLDHILFSLIGPPVAPKGGEGVGAQASGKKGAA
ncbi:MAG: response regulator [Hyphomonas sp.]|nr:response regulator [Hyphomonas sp.]HRX73293.1 response regulator [Hyphomonas sp.]